MNSGIEHSGKKFYKIVDGLESVMEYEMNDATTVVFYHTYVPEELRGKGLAKEIIKEGLDWAMAEHFDVIPACSAVRIFIERNPEYKAYFLK